MQKLPLTFIIAILLLVAGAQTVSAWDVPTVTDATDITYSSFKTVMTHSITVDHICSIKYGLTSGGEDLEKEQYCEVGIPETFIIAVPAAYQGRVIYYYGYDGTEVSTEHTATLLAGSITTGSASGQTSNSFNVSVTGINGTEVWVMFGSKSVAQNWQSPIQDTDGGTDSVYVYGSPLYGGETVYYKACDSTGCGAVATTTLLAVTTMPTIAAKKIMDNITRSRFNFGTIQTSLYQTLTQSAPAIVMYGWALFMFGIGIWKRNKGAALLCILTIILAPFVMYADQGLYLGVPTVGQAIVTGVLALALTALLIRAMQK